MRIQDYQCSAYKNNSGSGLIEVAVGFMFFMVIVLTFLDLQLVLHGATLNDAIARDAARAASAGPPGKLIESKDRVLANNDAPFKRASSVVNSRRTTLSSPFEIADSIDVTETVEPPIPSELFGGPVMGTVTVRTTILIHPRFILGFLKIKTIPLTASKSFPYSWVIKSDMDGKSRNTHQ